jgi:NADPH-dependent 2,4-dienoyl-CoA reductase/sulfur reductase-like enzyme
VVRASARICFTSRYISANRISRTPSPVMHLLDGNPFAIVVLIGLLSNVLCESVKTKVAILGGGMSGVMAARTLAQANITDFLIIEGKPQLGGRMLSTNFMGQTVELGANWVQGTRNDQTGASNPIWDLALKYDPPISLLTGGIISPMSIRILVMYYISTNMDRWEGILG